MTFFIVATIIVVWMGVPFVAFTIYAGLTQVPDDIVEAAELDGAGAWQRFRYIVLPTLKPILLILTSLSVLWDFRVFTQIYVLQKAGGITRDTNLLGVYIYTSRIRAVTVRHRRGHRHRDGRSSRAADRAVLCAHVQARRRADGSRATRRTRGAARGRRGRAGRRSWCALFPVYWMVLTVVPPRNRIKSADDLVPADDATLDNYHRVFERRRLLDGDGEQRHRSRC